jgi:hypothetical protein
MERKLTTIFSTDVAGYSRLIGEDEEAAVHTLTAYRMASILPHAWKAWPPWGIYISGAVYEQVKSKLAVRYEDLGPNRLRTSPSP